MGEGGLIGTPAAVVNAVADALRLSAFRSTAPRSGPATSLL